MAQKRICIFILILVLMFINTGCGLNNSAKYSYTSDCAIVYFFDVGQADCSMVQFPDGKILMIDSGNPADADRIIDYLNSLNIKEIDYFVATHPHDDHIGGATEIFENFEILSVYMPNIHSDYLPKTKVYNNFLKAIDDEKCAVHYPTTSTVISEQEKYSIKVVSPDVNSIFSDLNDYSLTLLVNCFTNTILFTGDAEDPAELEMMNSGINLDSDILKVGHHGSKDSCSVDFLNKVTPMVSIISCGKKNPYGHPSNATLKRLNDIGSNIYRTDNVCTIVAKCYENGFNIETNDQLCLDGD